jgi:hypothetical protein
VPLKETRDKAIAYTKERHVDKSVEEIVNRLQTRLAISAPKAQEYLRKYGKKR